MRKHKQELQQQLSAAGDEELLILTNVVTSTQVWKCYGFCEFGQCSIRDKLQISLSKIIQNFYTINMYVIIHKINFSTFFWR